MKEKDPWRVYCVTGRCASFWSRLIEIWGIAQILAKATVHQRAGKGGGDPRGLMASDLPDDQVAKVTSARKGRCGVRTNKTLNG